ncbi:MAG: ABC transporter permease [Clostridia bacterium]|nr:ABC transporter permease [Clostridia bacterium]
MVKSPLRKRHLRELRSDPGKYLVIFILLVLSISEISGFMVADESMLKAYNESFEKYNIEDGNFTVDSQLTRKQADAIEAAGVRLYDLQSVDTGFDNGSTLRIFPVREKVDLACLMDGRLPESPDEIAVDRMYADNNGLAVEDVLTTDRGKAYTITGLVALSDYSTMFESNKDMMFDATLFGVAVVSRAAFKGFDRDLLTWRYAWKYDKTPVDEREESEMSEEFLKALNGAVSLENYLPRYQNQAITFTGSDFGRDRAMMTILLYIIIVIVAFVFGVTTSNTIAKESTVIGTLMASGATRKELIRHYMALPLAVTVAAGIVGNILGYTVMKNVNAKLYYASYSLPTYVTVWSTSAFIKTTIVPLILMIVITYFILSRKLKLSPLKFLRKDLSTGKSRRAVALSPGIPFFTRFRMRVALQNMSGYALILVGILFANFLLLFSMMFPDVLKTYMKALPESMFCKYQYILELPASAVNEDQKLESMVNMMMFRRAVETEDPGAEKFSAYSLNTSGGKIEDEILLYGIADNSRYLDLDPEPGEVFVSSLYADKWRLGTGDEIELKEAYGDDVYRFTVSGIYPYDGAMCVFMDLDDLNDTFGLGQGTFAGYFSDSEITDIDEKYIGRVIDIDALSKTSRQLEVSMGDMMQVVSIFSVVMYVMLIYLLSKTIIEKNAVSISMAKILGYTGGEIGKIYVLLTSIVVVVFTVLSVPLIAPLMRKISEEVIRMEMTGWLPLDMNRMVYVRAVLYGLVTYALVAVLQYRKISKVPMTEALKNVE